LFKQMGETFDINIIDLIPTYNLPLIHSCKVYCCFTECAWCQQTSRLHCRLQHITGLETSPQPFVCSEGGFLDHSEELPPFSPLLPARAPPYADEDVEPERAASPPLYVVPPYTEAQVSGQKFKSHICSVFWCGALY
jgi:hypothetical protein